MAPRHALVGVLLLSLAAPVIAAAQITTIANPQGFSGRETLITFEGQGSSGPPRITTLGGVTFSQGGTPYVSLGSDGSPRVFDPQDPIVIDNRDTLQPVTLAFASPATRLGFEIQINGCGAHATVQFFRGNTAIGSAQTGPSERQNPSEPRDTCSPGKWIFAAYNSAQRFDRAVISGPTNGLARLDNIRLEDATPTPPTITALPNPNSFTAGATLITFQGLSNPAITALSGATFSAGSTTYVSLGMDDRARPFGPPDPMTIDNRPAFSQPIRIQFASPVTRIAFEVSHNGCGETVQVEFFSGTTSLGSARTPASPAMPGNNCSPGYFVFGGFQLTAPFDSIRLTGPTNGYLRIDNLRFER